MFLLSLSVLIHYIDRSNLSIAAPLLQDELHISNTQLGTLLAAFFWVYALLQMPAGWLLDRFDVNWLFASGFLLWSSATAVTGVLHGFGALIAAGIALGVGESVTFPSFCKILSTYFSEAKRGFPQRHADGGNFAWTCDWHSGGRNGHRCLGIAAIFHHGNYGLGRR